MGTQSQPSHESVQMLDRRVQVKSKDQRIWVRLSKNLKSYFLPNTEMRCGGLTVRPPLQKWTCQALRAVLCMFPDILKKIILLQKSAKSVCFLNYKIVRSAVAPLWVTAVPQSESCDFIDIRLLSLCHTAGQ